MITEYTRDRQNNRVIFESCSVPISAVNAVLASMPTKKSLPSVPVLRPVSCPFTQKGDESTCQH